MDGRYSYARSVNMAFFFPRRSDAEMAQRKSSLKPADTNDKSTFICPNVTLKTVDRGAHLEALTQGYPLVGSALLPVLLDDINAAGGVALKKASSSDRSAPAIEGAQPPWPVRYIHGNSIAGLCSGSDFERRSAEVA